MQMTNASVQQVIDALPEPVQVINPDFTVDFSSKKLHQTFSDKVRGKCYAKFSLSEPCPGCPMRQAIVGNGPESVVVIGGDNKQYSALLYPMGPQPAGIIEVIRNEEPSRICREDEILKEQRGSYLDKMGTLTTSFFGMAHNLKNPLTALQGKIQIFGMRHPELKLETEGLLKQCENMTVMLGDLTEKFKLEQNTTPQQINLNKLLENEVRFINLDLNVKHKIQKKLDFAENLLPVSAVYSDLSMIFSHLIQNAITAVKSSSNKLITISTAVEGDFVAVTIQDDGCGIPRESIPRIFTPFYSTKSDDGYVGNPSPDGRGLGLFIVYQLVDKYNGSVGVDSSPDIGTKFTVRMPACKG